MHCNDAQTTGVNSWCAGTVVTGSYHQFIAAEGTALASHGSSIWIARTGGCLRHVMSAWFPTAWWF